MRHFLSHHSARPRIGRPFRPSDCSEPKTARSAMSAEMHVRNLSSILLVLVGLWSSSPSLAQNPFPTSRADNTRSNASTSETLLTPSNVNKSSFGLLFSAPVDNVVMTQPLYVPNVTIAGQVHNVVYVATMADSVYAFDADSGAQLWWVNFTNPSQGITVALVNNAPYPTTLPCGLTHYSHSYHREQCQQSRSQNYIQQPPSEKPARPFVAQRHTLHRVWIELL
jgi:hypothetical protein